MKELRWYGEIELTDIKDWFYKKNLTSRQITNIRLNGNAGIVLDATEKAVKVQFKGLEGERYTLWVPKSCLNDAVFNENAHISYEDIKAITA